MYIDILLGHLVYCHIQILIFLIQNLNMTIIEVFTRACAGIHLVYYNEMT